MKQLIIFSSLVATLLFAQPKDAIEFQLNHVSGIVLNKIDQSPLIDIKVAIMSGNNTEKHSTYTDDSGHFSIKSVGFVWKPKIRYTSREFLTQFKPINMVDLDSSNNIVFKQLLSPIPEELRIPNLSQNSVNTRAETFLIPGNVFYYLSILNDKYLTERIIIKSRRTLDSDNGLIVIKVNGSFYDPIRCYVPQMGRYENLASIIDDYFPSPIFEASGLPLFIPEDLLYPSVIFGKVLDVNSHKPVLGAEVRIVGITNSRMSDIEGRYAFQIDNAGTYELVISPPFGYKTLYSGVSEIVVKSPKGGWYLSNHYLDQ